MFSWRLGVQVLVASPPVSVALAAGRFDRLMSRRASTKTALTTRPTASLPTIKGGAAFEGDALVLGLSANATVEGYAQTADKALDGAVTELATGCEREGQSETMRLPMACGVKKLAVFGLGGRLEKLGAYAAELATKDKAKTVGISIEGWDATAVERVCRGIFEAVYVDNRFRTGDNVVKEAVLENVVLIGAEDVDVAAAAASAAAFAKGVGLARDIVAAPANVLTPKTLADLAMDLCAAYPDQLKGKVMTRAEVEARGMGAYLGVAKGASAENGPHFIHLTYQGPGTQTASLALVGKGLTYDSGGYNLKPSSGGMIELMKFDCGGSAAVLGAAKTLAELKVPGVRVDVIVAACENMISGDAMRPGDILTASNGKTIEVINTDAEGRLTLADALIYAENDCKPDAVIDVATLTGACIIALGNKVAGLFTPHDSMASELATAADHANERIWRLPLVADYNEGIKSNIADLKNVGGRPGASITAALFLEHFVSKDLPWAHLDIAGTAWDDKEGATGFAVKTLVEWVRARASS